jgi:hypothetical protein
MTVDLNSYSESQYIISFSLRQVQNTFHYLSLWRIALTTTGDGFCALTSELSEQLGQKEMALVPHR